MIPIWIAGLGMGRASSAAEQRPIVAILLSYDRAEESDSPIPALQSQMSDLDEILRLERVDQLPESLEQKVDLANQVGRESGAVAVLWFDFAGHNRAFLNWIEPAGDRILVREIRESDQGGRNEALRCLGTYRAGSVAMLWGRFGRGSKSAWGRAGQWSVWHPALP